MKTCLRFAPMIGSREGELPVEEARALAAHLSECPTCRGLANEVEATEGLLSEALLAKANARDFGPFVDEVMARVQANPLALGAGSAGRARSRRAVPARWTSAFALLRAHWKLATGAAVAVLVAASVFMYVERDVSEPEEQLASLEMELEGGSTVLQTSDGPVVLLEPDDSGS